MKFQGILRNIECFPVASGTLPLFVKITLCGNRVIFAWVSDKNLSLFEQIFELEKNYSFEVDRGYLKSIEKDKEGFLSMR